MNTSKIAVMKGVYNPEALAEQICAHVAGTGNAGSYLRGSLQFLERFPPNPFIVPLLRKALHEQH